MPRNRTYWNVLEAHIRCNPNDMLGMNSTIGANELRKLALLVARYAKINKGRDRTIDYMVRKLSQLCENGFIEAHSPEARKGICALTQPVWSQLNWQPVEANELEKDGN